MRSRNSRFDLCLVLLLLIVPAAALANLEIRFGDLSVAPAPFSSVGGCVQVPILVRDPNFSNRDLRSLTFTVEIDDPQGVIAGGTSGNMLVANAFTPTGAGTGTTGLTNPGTNLANANGVSTPNCGAVRNRVTEGQGAAISFPASINNFANWSLNNNFGGVGRKRGYLNDLVNGAKVGQFAQGVDTLVAVLEIPIVANPGNATISVRAVNGAGFNEYTFGSGQVTENFVLPAQAARVDIGAGGRLRLTIGELAVSPTWFVTGGCIQVPLLVNDPAMSGRDLRDLTYTLQISDPKGVISGGVGVNMLVANAFTPTGAGTGTTGLTNPGTNLANANGVSTPNCGVVRNRVTEGQGAAISFPASINNFANWSLNNNFGGVGRKRGFLIDAVNGAKVDQFAQGVDTLVAVLEIPIIANPGNATISISAVDAAGFNTYTEALAGGTQSSDNFVLPPSPSRVTLGAGGEIALKIGSLDLPSESFAASACAQIPILLNDPAYANRDIRDLTLTLEIADPQNIIVGGVATNLLVANSFTPTGAGTGTTGLTNPGSNLANSNGLSTPNCTLALNRVTQGQGSAISFPPSINNFANWSLNNNFGGVGRKRGFLNDLVNGAKVGQLPQGIDTLVAVLEIPIMANPGSATIAISPVRAVDNNTYSHVAASGLTNEQMIVPGSAATLRIAPSLLFSDGLE
jgi:hypothetical protein